MTDKTTLGDRMKGYEEAVGSTLLKRTPVIIRVDGKAFHTYTKKITTAVEPATEFHFSQRLHNVMNNTAFAMCHKIQNSVFAYTQSDEISILLRDWDTLNTQQWFGGKVQKIASVAGAMAASYFNWFWAQEFGEPVYDSHSPVEHPTPDHWGDLALFDARVFNVPYADVDNYFIWRQKDAIRNSINFIGRKYFSQKQMHGKNTTEVQLRLWEQHGVAWNSYPVWEQRGSCVFRNPNPLDSSTTHIIDDSPPVFTEDRMYVMQHLVVGIFDEEFGPR